MKVHFIGIGGIGISGLARYLKSQGVQISGSDIATNKNVKKLQKDGAKITIPHTKDAIDAQDLIIHSAIIKPDNIEIIEAKKQNIPILSRKDALEKILQDKRVFSVCGAHGKSTTTAILSSILPHFGAIIGAESKEFDCNVREVPSQSLIFEADESDKSFLNSNPYCAIVTNTEPEHMENYNHNLDEFYGCYKDFLFKAKKRVINMDDPFLSKLDIEAIRLYPQRDITNINYFLRDDHPYTRFCLKDFGEFEVWGFGEHTALNASLAILASLDELPLQNIKNNLKNYKGIKKRFDIVSKSPCIIIDDYAHHPTEIKTTLQAVKIYTQAHQNLPVICIWQPHKYSRFLDNQEAFIQCFKGCDRLIILPVWKAGEKHVEIDFSTLFSSYTPTFASHIQQKEGKIYLYEEDKLLEILDKGLIIGFGAGDITYQLRENHV
ncbi:UDP-N-acetylmuramate--L-alanine ligase [Helicobacter cholecystus]|uniref:UDP-N-acetylmuramate--L-alanine ligase n=1 Tax=Helicobacter cholecystus TaxID=45498 RepID=A0A3D8IUY0_9HELI|nr:UDP-N-acetylmuramate--L-alanine ligase [Helicobacter cholecystus]RDU68810.1 UDP-N-acetylmuramate--L-alanine ligase [Helicobacter cholecystus]VEJ23912.1 UDP-N-acetylmuramate--L-alanine ligase [Helicobacter cholecystus]